MIFMNNTACSISRADNLEAIKGVAVLPMIPPSQMSKILDDPLWSNTDFGRAIAENYSKSL